MISTYRNKAIDTAAVILTSAALVLGAVTAIAQPPENLDPEATYYQYLDPIDGLYRHMVVDRDCLAEAGIWPQGGVDEDRLRFHTRDRLALLRQEVLMVLAQQACMTSDDGDTED